MSTTDTTTAVDIDIELRYSGGASNSNQELSIGGIMSSVRIPNDVLNNLWPDVTGPEAGSGRTQYRCCYVYNSNVLQNRMDNVKIFISSNTQSDDSDISIGVGSAAKNATEQTIPSQVSPPPGVVFKQPDSETTALALGTISALQKRSIWIKRVIKGNAQPVLADFYELKIQALAPIKSSGIAATGSAGPGMFIGTPTIPT